MVGQMCEMIMNGRGREALIWMYLGEGEVVFRGSDLTDYCLILVLAYWFVRCAGDVISLYSVWLSISRCRKKQ